jgi:hypothetical protein
VLKPDMTNLAPQSRLIDAMMSEEKLLDHLVAHWPATAKFQRVLNEEQVARELRLSDVARMLDLPIDTLLAVAEGGVPAVASADVADEQPLCGWVEPGDDRTALDLRPLFERGIEPLAMILEKASQLQSETTLIIDAPFHPLPLRRLLGGRGFDSFARQLSSSHWQVAFRRKVEQAV